MTVDNYPKVLFGIVLMGHIQGLTGVLFYECEIALMEEKMNRDGFATRVEVNTVAGTIGCDLVEIDGFYHLQFNGTYLSDTYADKEDAIDAAIRVLCSLRDGNEDITRDMVCEDCGKHYSTGASVRCCDACLRGEGAEDQAQDYMYDDYPGEVLPTGWDAADHKALYE